MNSMPVTGSLHHLELWVPDLDLAVRHWGWLLAELGYRPFQDWSAGRSWALGHTYLVLKQSPALTSDLHDRCRPGLNHLAFHAGDRARVNHLVHTGQSHGWRPLFEDRYPYAGGPTHYASYLVDTEGFEVELIATEHPS